MAIMKCQSLEEALIKLRQHEAETTCRFICYKSCKPFAENKVTPTAEMRIHFNVDGIPYFQFGSRTYLCSQGKDVNLSQKKKYAENRDKKAQTNVVKRYNVKGETKKKDCPVRIFMKRIFLVQDYQLPKLTKHQKTKTSDKIKSVLLANQQLNGEDCIVFSLPQPSDHKNHPVGANAKLSKCLNDLIRKKIEQLVGEGIRNVQIIQEYLTDYIRNVLQVDEEDMTMEQKPQRTFIQAIVKRTRSKLRWSKMDQQNMTAMIEKWNKQECNVFFRPYVIQDLDHGTKMKNFKSKLLFVYQDKNMQRLYELYGKNSILLDAAYKTCEYALPLYFLVVRTNVDYQVVGVFVTQFETTESITEALALIKKWNPSIEPKYGMVALAAKEIHALEEVFPKIQVFICAFHREKTWTRWGMIKKKKIPSEMKKTFLVYLRAIANAPTQEELTTAVQKFHDWEHFNNSPLKSYFENTWSPEMKRWALAYKPYDLLFDANNSVEQINEELEYKYLHDYKQCSLSEMIQVIVTKFIPSRYEVYCRENVEMSSLRRTSSGDLPEYLHNRPAWLVDHVQKLVSPNQDLEQRTPSLDADRLQVPSSTHHNSHYDVVISESTEICTCTCEDYRRHLLICKHIVMLGGIFDQWQLEKIASWVFKNPIFGMDKHCIEYEAAKSTVKENDNPNDQGIIVFDDLEDHQLENHEPLVSDINLEEEKQLRALQQTKRKNDQLVLDVQAKIRCLESLLFTLPNEQLGNLHENLKVLNEFYQGCEKSVNL